MKRNHLLLYLIPFLFVNPGCQESEEVILSKNEVPVVTTIDIQHPGDDIPIETALSLLRINPIISKDSLYFTGQNKLIPYKGHYLLADLKLAILLLLDSNGKEISRIGEIGSGKGQFVSIEDFNIDYFHDQILIFSNESQSLTVYSSEGKFIETCKLPFFAFAFSVIDSKHLVFFLNQNTNKTSGQFNLLVTNHSGKILQRLFPITDLPHMGFSYSGFIRQGDSSVLFSEPLSDSVYEIQNGIYRVKYSIPFGDKSFPGSVNKSSHKMEDYTFKFSWINGPLYESGRYILMKYQADQRLHEAVVNKLSGKIFNSKKNRNIESLLYNVYGEKNGIYYAIVDFDKVDPLLKLFPDSKINSDQFDLNLYKGSDSTFPFKNPVMIAFTFNF